MRACAHAYPLTECLFTLACVYSCFVQGKIYLGGLPYSLNENDVRPFLEAFGPLKALCLMRDAGMTTTKVRPDY